MLHEHATRPTWGWPPLLKSVKLTTKTVHHIWSVCISWTKALINKKKTKKQKTAFSELLHFAPWVLTLISKRWKTETLFCKLKCVSKHTLISCLFIYTCACVWVCAHGMPSCACWNKITTYGAHYSSIFEFKKFFLHNSCNNL